MKKIVALFLLTVFVVCNTAGAAACEKGKITVIVNGGEFCFGESKPIVKNGRILVPLQCGIFEKFSATTEYDHIYQEAVVRTETYLLTLYMGQFVIYNKGEKCYELDAGPEYRNGQAYVPLRAFMESLGQRVEYDAQTHTAIIS